MVYGLRKRIRKLFTHDEGVNTPRARYEDVSL